MSAPTVYVVRVDGFPAVHLAGEAPRASGTLCGSVPSPWRGACHAVIGADAVASIPRPAQWCRDCYREAVRLARG